MCGVYPNADALTAGDEISSTYEGRHITMLESELIHPFRAGNMVNKGDPVIITLTGDATKRGHAVGVAFNTATLATDLIAVDTEGIWNLNVFARDDSGAVDVNPGDPLFIHDGSDAGTTDPAVLGVGDCAISKIRNLVTQIPFGYALGYIASGDLDGNIAVKVHWDPEEQQDEFAKFLAAHGSDNMKSFTLLDESTGGATGAVVYAKGTFTGAKTGTSHAINHFLETFWQGDVPNACGIYMYSEIDGNKTISRLTQLEMYCGARGNAVATQYDIVLGRNSDAALTSPGNDAFIYFREHATVQDESSVLMLQGNNAAEYFVTFGSNPDTGLLLLETNAPGGAKTHRVRCNTTIGVRWLHLFDG